MKYTVSKTTCEKHKKPKKVTHKQEIRILQLTTFLKRGEVSQSFG